MDTTRTSPVVAIVNVPYGAPGPAMLPLGVASIASYARASGIPVDAYEFGGSTSNSNELVSRFPALRAYKLIGLSFYNTNARQAFELADALKRANPSVMIVAGGPHASACAQEVLRECYAIDVAVKGEGEVTFVAIAEACTAGHRPELAGTAFRRGSHVVEMPERPVVDDLNSLPTPSLTFISDGTDEGPYFYDKRDRRRRRAVALVTSRSCPYNCSFCAIILIGRKWRRLDVGRVRQDFEDLSRRHGPFEHVYFMDANFFVQPERAVAIARALSETAERPTFSFSTRVNQILRGADHLRLLCELGLRAIEVGVESASPDALARFAKDVAPEENDAALDLLAELGLDTILDFIMFDAETSLADLRLNLNFFERHALDTYLPWDHLQSHLTPYVGTPIRAHYEQQLGMYLPIHELPEPSFLFRDRAVRDIYVEIRRFFQEHRELKAAVRNADRRAATRTTARERARAAMNAVTLRRLPFVVLRGLVAQAFRGETPAFERALPIFRADNGEAMDIRGFLAHALDGA